MSQQQPESQQQVPYYKVFIPLAAIVRILSQGSTQNVPQNVLDILKLKDRAKALAILRGWIYAKVKTEGLQSVENINECLQDQQAEKAVYIGDPCYRIIGVVYELGENEINTIKGVVLGSSSQATLILAGVEELPTYTISHAFIMLNLYSREDSVSDTDAGKIREAISKPKIINKYSYDKQSLQKLARDKEMEKLAQLLDVAGNKISEHCVSGKEEGRKSRD